MTPEINDNEIRTDISMENFASKFSRMNQSNTPEIIDVIINTKTSSNFNFLYFNYTSILQKTQEINTLLIFEFC